MADANFFSRASVLLLVAFFSTTFPDRISAYLYPNRYGYGCYPCCHPQCYGSSLPFFRRGFYGGLNAYGLPPSTMDTLGSYGYGLSSLECLDRSSQCPYWASTGQCSTGGLYLSRICPQSCGSCLGFGSGLSNGLGAAISTALGSGLGAGLSAGLGSVFNGYNLYGIGGYSGYGTGIGEGLYGENALYGDSLLPYRGLRSGIYPFKYKPSSKTVTASESVKPKSPFKQ